MRSSFEDKLRPAAVQTNTIEQVLIRRAGGMRHCLNDIISSQALLSWLSSHLVLANITQPTRHKQEMDVIAACCPGC